MKTLGKQLRKGDTTLFWLSMIISLIGLVFIMDAGFAQSLGIGSGVVPQPFITQCVVLILSIFLYLGAKFVRPEMLRKNGWIVILGIIGLLILVEIPGIGREQNNARRWLGFGRFLVQPAEFAKLGVIAYLAASLAKKVDWNKSWATRRKETGGTNQVFVPKLERLWPALVVLIVCLLVEREKDLGTASVILVTSMAIFFSAPVTSRSVVIIGGIIAVGLYSFVHKEQYRVDRFLSHGKRWERENINNDTYQTTHSEMAMASGGLLGTGIATGRAKYMLPAATTDYVMATVAEECGFWGPMLCLGLVGAIALRLLKFAKLSHDNFRRLFMSGVAYWLVVQACTNLMMANATLPSIGIPFPFVSAGGSSLMAIWFALGLCDRMSHESQKSEVWEGVNARNRNRRWNGRTRISRT
jgi:cell division protein FtsW